MFQFQEAASQNANDKISFFTLQFSLTAITENENMESKEKFLFYKLINSITYSAL